MSDLVIVDGDLEKLSSSTSDLATTLSGVDVVAEMTSVPGCIPGATSASLSSSAGSTIDTRRDTLERSYQDYSTDMTTALQSFQASDGQAEAAMLSAGHLVTESSSDSSRWYGRMLARLG